MFFSRTCGLSLLETFTFCNFMHDKTSLQKVGLDQVREVKHRNKNNTNYLMALRNRFLREQKMFIILCFCRHIGVMVIILIWNLLWVTVATALFIFTDFIILCWGIKNLLLHQVSVFCVFVSITETVARRSSVKAVLKIKKQSSRGVLWKRCS